MRSVAVEVYSLIDSHSVLDNVELFLHCLHLHTHCARDISKTHKQNSE